MKNYQVVMAIICRLKTGCKWHQLAMKQFFYNFITKTLNNFNIN